MSFLGAAPAAGSAGAVALSPRRRLSRPGERVALVDCPGEAFGLVRIFARRVTKGCRDLSPAGHTQFDAQRVGVSLRSAWRDVEPVRDLGVRAPSGDQANDLPLADGEPFLKGDHGGHFQRTCAVALLACRRILRV